MVRKALQIYVRLVKTTAGLHKGKKLGTMPFSALCCYFDNLFEGLKFGVGRELSSAIQIVYKYEKICKHSLIFFEN